MRKSRYEFHRSRAEIFAIGMVMAMGGLYACVESRERVPEPVLNAWEQRWNATVDEFTTQLASDFRNKISPTVAPLRKEALIEEMTKIFLDEVSWDAMGKDAVEEQLIQICGIDYLKQINPYITGELLQEEKPEQLKSESRSCAIEIDLFVTTAPLYALAEISNRELLSLFRRHRIDPKGL